MPIRFPARATFSLTVALGLYAAPGASAADPGQDAAAAVALSVEGPQDVQGLTTFAPEAFAAAAPANAYEMVQRVPGFSIVEADTDVRGFAGGRGNVLVDSARSTSRHQEIDDLLKRIPATSVARIELIRGGAPGMDMAGHAALVNVVRRRAATSEMAVEAGVALAPGGWAGPQGAFEYGRRSGDRALDLALTAERELDTDTGPGRIRTIARDGAGIEDLETGARRVTDLFGSSASWRQPWRGGSLGLNAALRGEHDDERMERHDRDAGVRTELAQDAEDALEFEAGGRYVRPLGANSRLELVANQRLERVEALSLSREDDAEERFQEDTDSGETLLRIDLGHGHSSGWRLSAGLEGAFNFLESQARLSEDGERVELPGSDVRIEERRAEVSLGVAGQVAGAWTVEAGLRVEASALDQRGDTPTERDFTYLKPRLTGYWEPDDRNSVHLALSREVGQLDFDDFVASASLDTGVVSAGNAELEPDKTWQLVAGWERSFWEDGALGLTWTHERISDVVDRILVSSGGDVFDAPGNIGDGRRDTLELELATTLDRFGLPGVRVATELRWRDSSVTDPTTGMKRRISGEAPLTRQFELVHTLPQYRMTWGFDIELATREAEYSYDEVKWEREPLSWSLFAERRVGDGWRLRAEVRDLSGRRFTEMRDKYDGPRSHAALEEREYRSHRTPGQFLLSVRRSMGG